MDSIAPWEGLHPYLNIQHAYAVLHSKCSKRLQNTKVLQNVPEPENTLKHTPNPYNIL